MSRVTDKNVDMSKPHIRDQIQRAFAEPRRKAEVPDALKKPKDAHRGAERGHGGLQDMCEKWLKAKGYSPREKRTIPINTTKRWYVHINRAKANPILLDLVLMDAQTGSYLEVELKNARGRLSDEQKYLIVSKNGVLCWSYEQFQQAVILWEYAIEKRNGIFERDA